MDLFTYLMAKKGYNSLVHGDLFSYLLGKNQSQPKTATGTTLNISAIKTILVSLTMNKESTQDGTPTPDNPVPVETVKGYTNLFNKNNASTLVGFMNDSGKFVDTTGYKTLYIPCKKNTNYVVERIKGTFFRVGEFENVPENDSSWITRTKNDTADFISFQTTTGNYLAVTYYRAQDTITEQEILNSMLIAESNQELPYVPYGNNYISINVSNGTTTNKYPIPLNNNEIVGIGDYLDELVVDKDGHVWLNKKTGKVVLDGSENWVLSNNGNFFNYKNAIFPLSPSQSTTLSSLSNYYTKTSYNDIYGANVDYGFGFGSTARRIDIRNKDISNVADFQTWLSTHNTEVYFPLATPELIDLNATVNIELFKGSNTITNSEDASMTIEYY